MADPRLVRQLQVVGPAGLGVSQLPRAAETITGLNAQSLENRKLDYSVFPVAASGAVLGDILSYDGSHWRSQKWTVGPFAVGQAPPVGAVTGQVNVTGPLYGAATSYLQTLIAGASTLSSVTVTGAAVVQGNTQLAGLSAAGTTLNSLGVSGSTNLAALTAGPTSVGTLAASGLFIGPLSASGTITGTTALTRAASTGGLPTPILHVSNPADTSLPNSTYSGDVVFDFGANSRQLVGGGAAVGSFDLFQINAGTITALSGQIINAAATVHIVGSPASGSNVAITNACALQVQGRICFGNNIAQQNFAGFTFSQGRNSSQYNMFLLAPSNTGNMPVTTETNLSYWNPNGTITWTGGGTLATQRENLYGAPTYAATSATAITDAATVAIAGAPAQGANMTLTNAYALWLQAGGLRCTGHLFFDGGTAPTAASGSAAGSSGVPAPAVGAGATDTRGTVTFGTGAAPTSGNMAVVTFGTAFAQAPYVMVSANNGLTALLHPYVTSISTTGFTLGAGTAPLLNQGNTVYSFTWWVVQ